MNIKQIGFGSFLDNEEVVLRVFRRPFLKTFWKILLSLSIWGVIIFGLWTYLPPEFFYIWVFFAVVGVYKITVSYLNWYINAIIMTNVGLIFVEWPSLFQKQSNRIDFFDLDQVGVLRLGFKSFFGNYGTLQFYQAGGNLFEMKNINRPHRVARIIEKQKEKLINNKNFTEESSLKNLISQLVLTHVKKNNFPSHTVEKDKEIETVIESSFSRAVDTNVQDIDVEKELDDSGGIEIDFNEKEGK